MAYADSVLPDAWSGGGLRAEGLEVPVRRELVRPEVVDGRGLLFWYHALGVARASASCRYRIGNLVERMRGATVVVGTQLPRGALDGVHTLVCARPYVDRTIAKTLGGLRARGIRLVADFDDLLFDCPVEAFPPVLQATTSGRARHAQRLRTWRESLAHFDAFTVSTEPLAARLQALRPDAPVAVVPNGISERWLDSGRLLHRSWRPGDPRIIRYLPGSPTHDVDFEVARPALERFMSRHADVRLEIVGPLSFERAGFPAGRVSHHALVRYEELPRYLASTWVNIAPLAQTDFNVCKSAVKYLEAAAFGAPTIASPVGEVPPGCIEARSTDAWVESLESLYDDAVRERFATRARAFVMQHRTARASVAAFAAARASWEQRT